MNSQPPIDPRPIPCKHETEGVPSTTVLPDYHPLSYAELVELLAIAQKGDWKVASGVQCRLGQAIPGAECPHAIKGAVSEKSAQLDIIFVSARRRGQLTETRIADMLFALMEVLK